MDAVALLNRRGEYVLAIVDGERVDIDEPVWERIHPDDRERVESLVMRCILLGKSAKYRGRTKDGGIWDIHLYPVDAKGVAVIALCWRVDSRISRLTKRHREVCRLVGYHWSSKQIAAKLGVSLSTVDTHQHRAREILEMNSRQFRDWCCRNRDRL